MPKFLFIDTSAAHTQIAYSVAHKVVANEVHHQPNEQAKVLNKMIDTLSTTYHFSLNEIDAIAINAGPGSYTGLRVGMGVAKGLCYALDIPLLLFNKLDLLAYQLQAEKPITIVLRARAGEGFIITKRKENINREAQHIFYKDLNIQEYLETDFYTDDETLREQYSFAKELPTAIINIEKWQQLALLRYEAKDFDDVAYSEPFYLKEAFTTTPKNKI